jgi:hypothetical protein
VAATRAAAIAFNQQGLIPSERFTWDDYNSRLSRYAIAEGYYSNVVYDAAETYSARLKSYNKLYTHLRPIYNPVYRLVESYTAKVYGGSLDFGDLSTGAIPILMASDPLKDAIRQLWIWSNWRIQKGLYVRTGANLGDVFLKVVDEPDKEKVRMEVLHPGKVAEIETDAVGNVKSVVIQYTKMETVNGAEKDYTYTETIDENEFVTAKDGAEFPFYKDANGKPVSRWENPYGFVPLVKVKHKDVGMQWGANAYPAQMGKINELNDAASLLNDQVRKAINLVWYFAGVKGKPSVDTSADEKDKVPAVYGPEGSQPYPMIGNIDITAAGVNVDRMLLELERDMPELALHRLRDGGNLTAPGVRSAYSDAIDRFTEAQGIYDDGLIRAQKMAVSIGGLRGYEGFQSFNLNSFDAGDLEHYIKDRPIVADELSKSERIQALQAADAPIWLIMEELDFDQEKIDEVVAEKEKAAREAARGFAQGVFGEGDDEETDGEETTDTEDSALPEAA